MAYEMVMPYHLHMPSYFLETFTEYPYAASCPKNLNIMRQVYRNLSISVIPSIEGGLNNHSAPPL